MKIKFRDHFKINHVVRRVGIVVGLFYYSYYE